jgi:hypothetical protein
VKKIFLALGILIIAGLSTFLAIKIPDTLEKNKVEELKVAKKFDVKVYESWLLTYTALQEAEDTFYDNLDWNDEEKAEDYKAKNYPEKAFPTLVEDFGISVQKDYAGEYVYNKQKEAIIRYLDKELKKINTAINNYQAVNPDNPNAFDATVLKSLKDYNIVFSKIKNNLENTTLEESKNKPIGEVLKRGLSEEDLTKPLIAGKISTEYVMTNLKHYSASYDAGRDKNSDAEELKKILFTKKQPKQEKK